jgi:YkoY family integral membrane protein
MLNFTVQDIPLISWYIGVLIFLEGLLSADNALVLALMVRHLPRRDQRRVLVYGIWGAIGFRIVAVALSAWLIRFWFFEVLGGLYLVYLAISHFIWPEHAAVEQEGPGHPADGRPPTPPRRGIPVFWRTVIAVTWTDIVFSIDSILAAVAMADEFPDRFGPNGKIFIVFVGGVLGIITMRFVVRYFLMLLDRFPGLAEGAYFLVGWIGLKLLVNGLHRGEWIGVHIPGPVFWSGMLLIAVLSLIIRPRPKPMGEAEVSQLLDDSGPDGTGTDSTGPASSETQAHDDQPPEHQEDGPAHGNGQDVLEPLKNRVP